MDSVSNLSASRLRIIVLGYLVRSPLGGRAWTPLQYVLGLHRLGHDVFFVEDSDDVPWSCYDPVRHVTDTDPTYGLQFVAHAFEKLGLPHRWAYYDAHTFKWMGPYANKILEVCASADLVLSIGDANPLRPWLKKISVRALIDQDPLFTQVRNLTEPERRKRAVEYTAFFSRGENIRANQCTIPDDGLPWKPTRQPIVLDLWPVTPGPADGKFTNLMQWESYPAREYGGVRYGMKSDSFRLYLELPEKAGSLFELAVGSASAPRELLRNKGWLLRNPLEPSQDPWTYQRYIHESKAEFAIAKHGYVVSRSGWFSERSATYLASGRPVLAQETGFSDWLPAKGGVLPFSNPENALEGIEEINRRYAYHCREARAVAEEYFDSRKILMRLIEEAFHFSSHAKGVLPRHEC